LANALRAAEQSRETPRISKQHAKDTKGLDSRADRLVAYFLV
jgi:hypothetical protein